MLAGSRHLGFMDVAVFADLVGLREDESLGELFGAIKGGGRVMEGLRAYVSDFAEFLLRNKEEGDLAGLREDSNDAEFVESS